MRRTRTRLPLEESEANLKLLRKWLPPRLTENWEEDLKRFAGNVRIKSKTSCWLWCAGIEGHGYARGEIFGYDGHVHRAVFMAMNGRMETHELACHKCDVRHCVNPFHCFSGSSKDNSNDAKQKNRVAFGKRHGMTKLTVCSVRKIKARLKKKEGYSSIASRFGISVSNVWSIARGRTWIRVEI